MARYDDIVEGYQEKQAALRRSIEKLEAGRVKGRGIGGSDTAIQKNQREIVELNAAIARCREKSRRW